VTATSPSVRYRDLLAVRQMRAVLLAHSVSMTGSVVAEVALSVLLYARTGSSLLSAAALALGFLPNVLGGTVLSGLADRFPVRRLLVACDLLSAAVVALMLVPGLPIWALLGLVVLLGTVPRSSTRRAAQTWPARWPAAYGCSPGPRCGSLPRPRSWAASPSAACCSP